METAVSSNRMPTLVTEAPNRPSPPAPPRKRWTRDDCVLLDAVGAFGKLELIDGELIDKMGKLRPHQIVLVLIDEWLGRVFGNLFISTETPIDVSPEDNHTSEPEPDAVVLSRPATEFPVDNPKPSELRLVVEVSDSSLHFDLTTKASLYARAGIVEYWVLDVSARRCVVHRNPRAGRYTSIVAYSTGEEVAPLAAPDRLLSVASVFPL